MPRVLDTRRLWLQEGAMPSSQVYFRGRPCKESWNERSVPVAKDAGILPGDK